ncbi:chalcone isomerase family protein [Pseudoalteromonas sp. SMS1]|uniref:chalcone isomerase family protein n=1 Tax=Pseudoalteromonas sp. SMS1 TaxID=2908894 RepID=UPI001F18B4BF|nr:chalcone isomerase family protein [Pseudoalteromonas sp. SMS1]MCF2857766.1 chalcone isomerase family protein [Pseudoalteromonas sp. SMS1]
MNRFRHSLMTALMFFSCLASSTGVNPDAIKTGMSQVGETARMTYLFWDVYDISLYTPTGEYNPAAPFVLQLTYLRELSGEDIAERSLEEMQKQGFDDVQTGQKWLEEMKRIFPDVEENYSLLGVRTPAGTTKFYNDETLLGEVKDPRFTKWFFDIWLSAQTSEPKMRRKLLGEQS